MLLALLPRLFGPTLLSSGYGLTQTPQALFSATSAVDALACHHHSDRLLVMQQKSGLTLSEGIKNAPRTGLSGIAGGSRHLASAVERRSDQGSTGFTFHFVSGRDTLVPKT